MARRPRARGHAQEDFDANDMMNMGGLRQQDAAHVHRLPGRHAGPGRHLPFAGFWSKDEILAEAWHECATRASSPGRFFVWLLLSFGAL